MKIKPIILSGGSGTRLWPLSRENKPKQFADIFNNKSNLFEETLMRINNPNFLKPIIISNKNQRFNILKSIQNCNAKYDKLLDNAANRYDELEMQFIKFIQDEYNKDFDIDDFRQFQVDNSIMEDDSMAQLKEQFKRFM